MSEDGQAVLRMVVDGEVVGEYSVIQLDEKGNQAPPEMPSMVTRASNVIPALFKWAVAGLPIETRPAAEARLAICETNECGYFDGSVCRHTKCGCFSKIKTFFATEHCPIGRW